MLMLNGFVIFGGYLIGLVLCMCVCVVCGFKLRNVSDS